MGIGADFISLLFPRCCVSCLSVLVKGEDVVCTQCIFNMPRIHYDAKKSTIKDRLLGSMPIVHALVFLKFMQSGITQKLLHQIKYNGRSDVATKLGEVYGLELKERGFSTLFDVIIPVPLHPAKRRKRGYNQSALFAKGIAMALQTPFLSTVCVRKRNTPTQTKQSKIERWRNVAQAFSVLSPQQIEGKHVLLVDDVVTTGATVEACGRQLIYAGCSAISVAFIAEV